jgi:hypothetical protein
MADQRRIHIEGKSLPIRRPRTLIHARPPLRARTDRAQNSGWGDPGLVAYSGRVKQFYGFCLDAENEAFSHLVPSPTTFPPTSLSPTSPKRKRGRGRGESGTQDPNEPEAQARKGTKEVEGTLNARERLIAG